MDVFAFGSPSRSMAPCHTARRRAIPRTRQRKHCTPKLHAARHHKHGREDETTRDEARRGAAGRGVRRGERGEANEGAPNEAASRLP